jgi:hypothetical protein
MCDIMFYIEYEIAREMKSHQWNVIYLVWNTNHRLGQTQTPGYTWDRIRCLGGVDIPWLLVTSAVRRIS